MGRIGLENDNVTIVVNLPRTVLAALDNFATKINTSRQSLILVGILSRFATHRFSWWHKTDKDCGGRIMRGRERDRAIKEILDRYDYVPQDIQDEIEFAKIRRGIR